MSVTGPIYVGFPVTSARGGEFNALDASVTGGLILARNPVTDTPARAHHANQIANLSITGGVSNVATLVGIKDANGAANPSDPVIKLTGTALAPDMSVRIR